MINLINAPFTPLQNKPQLSDLMDEIQRKVKLEINCHHIGTIEIFNPLDQTAQVTINYKKTVVTYNTVLGQYTSQLQDYPLLIDCPVVSLGGGNGCLTFPVEPGDECQVFFNDRDFDNWYAGNANAGTTTGRLHSYSDAVCLVGVNSLPNIIPNYSSSAVELRTYDGLTKVAITAGTVDIVALGNNFKLDSVTGISASLASGVTFKINALGQLTIENVVGSNFVTALIQLFNDIQMGLVQTMLGPQPLVMPTFAADLALLQGFSG